MNRDEIQKIPAGREMDMLIAVEVMGWRVDAETAYSPSGSANARQGEMGEPWLPYYSTDMSDAWEVVGRMNEYADLFSGSLIIWKAFLDELHGSYLFVLDSEHAATLVCRAALLTTIKEE